MMVSNLGKIRDLIAIGFRLSAIGLVGNEQ